MHRWPWQLARSVPLGVMQFTLDENRSSSHSIICKVTLFLCYFATLIYLYLNVLSNLRTNVQVDE